MPAEIPRSRYPTQDFCAASGATPHLLLIGEFSLAHNCSVTTDFRHHMALPGQLPASIPELGSLDVLDALRRDLRQQLANKGQGAPK